MSLVPETVPSSPWYRIADPSWSDPVDPSFAATSGGRWNPPRSWPTLYLNGDVVTARLNLRLFIQGWPFEPEDLRADAAPILVEARLPRGQRVADVHTPEGVEAAGLPPSYPLDNDGDVLTHERCQPIGASAHGSGLRGVVARSATSPRGEGRELAWFPATARSKASVTRTQRFEDWYWA